MPKTGKPVTYRATIEAAPPERDEAESTSKPDARAPQAPPPLEPAVGAAGAGWRKRLSRLRPGARNRDLRERVAAPVTGCERIAVLSRKGGVGKTTTALMLGHLLASHRQDRVVAVDCNPEAGSLGHRVHRKTQRHAGQLLTHEGEVRTHADVRRFTNQAPSRLEVLAAADDAGRATLLDDEEARRLLSLIEPHYDVACIDTGPAITHPVTRAVVAAAEHVVVVVPPSIEGSRTAGATFEWLRGSGHADLAARSVAVINTPVPSLPIDVDDLAAQLRAHCRGVVRVPFDEHLATGGEAIPTSLRKATRRAYLELAATVGDGFNGSRPRMGPLPPP